MKVLFVSQSSNPHGGAGRSLLDLLVATARSFDVTLVAPDGGLAEEARAIGVRVRAEKMAMLSLREPMSWARTLTSIQHLGRIVDEVAPDVVYANTSMAAQVVLPVTRVTRIPAVVHHRGARVSGATILACSTLWSSRDTAVFVSKTARSALKDWVLAGGGRSEVVYNAVAVESIPFISRGAISRRPRLGFVGRMTPEKGFGVFCDTVELLRRRGFDVEADAYGPGMVGLAELPAGVHYRGVFPPESTGSVLSAIDLLICPFAAEGFGRVYLEGMLSGCIVVASSGGAAPEMLGHGLYGNLVALNRPPDFADAIELAMRKGILEIGAMRQAARTHAEAFTSARLTAEIHRVLCEVKGRVA